MSRSAALNQNARGATAPSIEQSRARTAGWTVLAKEALELSALALAVRFMKEAPRASAALSHPRCHPEPLEGSPDEGAASAPSSDLTDTGTTSVPGELVEPQPAQPQVTPLAFIMEGADARTRLYSARDEHGSIYAAFYADGRLRVAFEDHRLAGIVQNGHAHLLDVGTEVWSECFVRVTPEGALQLELRDGPLDGRVLTCEALKA